MPAAPSLEGVLFDFGGTLFDHAPEADLLVREAARLGRPIEAEQAAALWAEIDAAAMEPAEVSLGRDLDAAVWAERWSALYAIADRAVAGLGAALDAAMLDPATWVPFAGTVELLHDLNDRGVPVGILSNTGWEIGTVLRHTGVEPFIDVVVVSYEVGVVKPDPAIFRIACEQLGTDPERTLMVGDNAEADGGATRAGLPVWLVPSRVAPGASNGVEHIARLLPG